MLGIFWKYLTNFSTIFDQSELHGFHFTAKLNRRTWERSTHSVLMYAEEVEVQRLSGWAATDWCVSAEEMTPSPSITVMEESVCLGAFEESGVYAKIFAAEPRKHLQNKVLARFKKKVWVEAQWSPLIGSYPPVKNPESIYLLQLRTQMNRTHSSLLQSS